MATISFTQPAPFGALTVHRFVSIIDRALTAMADARAARKTRVQLSSLSDEVLRDIGVSRWDIETIIR